MDVASEQLEKARIWAYWGFAGLFNPIIGIIASSISLSILNRLAIEGDEDAQTEHASIMNKANIARVVSIVVLVLMIAGGIFAGSTVVDSINKNKAAEASYKDAVDRYEALY